MSESLTLGFQGKSKGGYTVAPGPKGCLNHPLAGPCMLEESDLVLSSSSPRFAHKPLHLEPAGGGAVLPSTWPG